jgi:hypothetical protein
MTTRYKIYSVRTTEETEKLLEQTYCKIIGERLKANMPLMTKGDAFAEIVKKAAEQQGVTV